MIVKNDDGYDIILHVLECIYSRDNFDKQKRYFLNHGELVDANTDTSEEGEADVLLGQVPVLVHSQDVLPRHQVQ